MFPDDIKLCLCVCVCSYHYTTASPIKYLSDFHWPMKTIIHQPSEHHGWLVLKASLQPWSVEHIKPSLWKALAIFWTGSTPGLNEAFRTSENQMALQDHFWMFGSESFVCRRLHKLAIWVAAPGWVQLSRQPIFAYNSEDNIVRFHKNITAFIYMCSIKYMKCPRQAVVSTGALTTPPSPSSSPTRLLFLVSIPPIIFFFF